MNPSDGILNKAKKHLKILQIKLFQEFFSLLNILKPFLLLEKISEKLPYSNSLSQLSTQLLKKR